MSAHKWIYKLQATLKKWFRPPLEVSIANHCLEWMFERGKQVQAQLYQAEYRPYMEHPHCFRHGLPVPFRETSPGHLECPYWQQHGPQPPAMPEHEWAYKHAQLRPFELERIRQETLQREEQPGAKLYHRLQEEGRTPSTNLTARLYPEQPPALRKPPYLEGMPETQEVQAQKRLDERDEMRRHGSGE